MSRHPLILFVSLFLATTILLLCLSHFDAPSSSSSSSSSTKHQINAFSSFITQFQSSFTTLSSSLTYSIFALMRLLSFSSTSSELTYNHEITSQILGAHIRNHAFRQEQNAAASSSSSLSTAASTNTNTNTSTTTTSPSSSALSSTGASTAAVVPAPAAAAAAANNEPYPILPWLMQYFNLQKGSTFRVGTCGQPFSDLFLKGVFSELWKNSGVDVTVIDTEKGWENRKQEYDVIIFGPFFTPPDTNNDITQKLRIWLSGEPYENRIVDALHMVDLAWACMDVSDEQRAQVTDHKVLFHYSPLFYLPGDKRFFLNNTGPGTMAPKDFLATKTKFCAFMYSHDVTERVQIFQAAQQFYKACDALGQSQYNGPPKAFTRWQGDFQDLAIQEYSPYKFVIAGENSAVNGYISEKISLPAFGKAIPIYWGASDVLSEKYSINPKRIIHVRDFPNHQALWKRVEEIDKNDDLFLSIVNEPFFINNVMPEGMNYPGYIPKLVEALQNRAADIERMKKEQGK